MGQSGNQDILSSNEKFRQKVNANTITILGGSITGTYLRLIDDISRSLGKGDELRVIPIRGGVVTNVRDILYLRGVDMGIIRADVIESYKGKPHFDNIENRLNYISVLHPEEFHLMTSNPNIKSVADLEGKVVAFHSETYLSGLIVLKKLNIKIKKLVKTTMFSAAGKTKSGEYDAIMRVTGKPFSGVDRLLKIDPNLRMIPIHFDQRLINTTYLPAKISYKDYPQLIPEGQEIQTIAVNAILGVYNWKPKTSRYERLEKFTEAFFSQYDKVLKRKGRHPKWDQINLAAKLPGWKRFGPAEKWLKKAKLQKIAQKSDRKTKKIDNTPLFRKFKKFVELEGRTKKGENIENSPELRAMFEEFKRWQSSIHQQE